MYGRAAPSWRGGLALSCVLLLGMVSPAPSAASTDSATPATSSRVDIHEILAGTLNRRFKVTVTHESEFPTPPSLMLERMSPLVSEALGEATTDLPEGSPLEASVTDLNVNAPPGFTITRATAPGPDWKIWMRSDRRSVLFWGGKLHPGRTLTFQIYVNVPSPPTNVTREWTVSVSDDEGETVTDSDPAQDGALSTKILVL